MLVVCPCGKKLNVKDSVAGKKIRCPACEEVFVAREVEEDGEEEEEEDERPAPAKKRKQQENDRVANQLSKKKRRDEEEDEDEEDEDEEDTRSSRKGRQRSAPKQGVPAWRLWGSVVVVVILLGVLGVVLWRHFRPLGIVELTIHPPNVEVIVDGKKHNLKPVADVLGTVIVTLELQPGPHEIKVSKADHETYTKQVTVKSDETEYLNVTLKYTGK